MLMNLSVLVLQGKILVISIIISESNVLFFIRESQMSRENIPLAIFYLKKAAQTGLPMAVHRMGQVHEHGLLNLPKDAWQGYSCYLRAAEDGHEGAMLDLSRLYAQGIAGHLMPQYEIAFKWCQRAADKGLEEAEYVLGYVCFLIHMIHFFQMTNTSVVYAGHIMKMASAHCLIIHVLLNISAKQHLKAMHQLKRSSMFLPLHLPLVHHHPPIFQVKMLLPNSHP